jgi:endonuclease/exonuclease/phosphatase family metal-dependent hydrolase
MSSDGGQTEGSTSTGSTGDTSSGTPTGSSGDTSIGDTSIGTSSGSSSGTEATTSSSSTGADEPSAPFTLLSLNLHCFRVDGTVYATNAERFAAIASLAAAREVAVLTLQEACERPGEKAIELLRAALEQQTGVPWTSTWALAHVAWEGTPDEADEGVGLLVRGALSDPGALEHAVQGALRRIAVSATLPPELGSPRVTSVHFEVFEPEARTMQAREVAAAGLVDTDSTYAVIIAGDFNDVEGSATHAAFPAMGYLAADAGLDPSGIDHVMSHRAAPLRPTLAEQVFLGAQAVSDHPGILVRFEPATGDIVTTTRITAESDPGADHFLSLRGDTAPLDWDRGFPMRAVKPGEHVFVTTEIAAPFAFKALLDDTTWQIGPNVEGVAGAAQVVMPVF